MAKKKKKKQNIFEKALDSVSNAFKPNKSSSSKPVATQAYTRASEKPVKKDTTPKKTETKKTSKPVAVQSYTRASERGTPTYNNTPAKKKVENKGIQTRRTTNVDSRTKTNTSKQTQDQHYMTRRNTNVDSRTGKNTARHGEWTPNEKGKATNVEVGAKNVQQAMAVLEQNKDYLKSTGQYDAMRNKILMAAKRNTAGDAGLQMIRHSGFTEKEQKKLKANHDLKAFEAAPGSTAADKKLTVALTNAAKTVASGVEGATSGVFNAVTTVADSLERHIEGDKDKQQSQIDRIVAGKLTKTEEEMGLGKYKGNRKAAEQYVKNQDKKNKQNTKTATQMSDKYLEKAAADMQTAKDEADTKVGSFLTDVAIQGAKMGTETLLGGGAVGRMPVMAAEVFGQGVKEARDGGGTEAQQLAYGLTSAAIEYLSEQVFGVAGKVFGKGYADDIVENLAGRITSKFGRNATRYVLGAIGEGLEEGFSDIATPFAQMIYNGKSKKETKKDLLSKESLTDMLYDMALGTAMGAFGATTQAFNGNFAAQDQELMNEIHSHRITDAKGNKIDRLEFAAQKMEQAQKKGQPISANQIEKEWRKAYFNELTKNKGEIKKRMKNGLTRDEALAEMDEGVKWSDSEAYVSKWANRLTTNGVKTKEAVNADRVISRLIDAKGDSKAVSDAELKQVLNDLNITWYTNGKPRSKSGENSLAALRDRLGLDKVTVAGESWEYGPTQENRDYAVDQSHLIAAIRQGARAVGESKAQIVEDAAEDVETMTNQAKAEQQAIDDLKNRRIVVGDLGEQTFDQFSEQFKNNFPDATDDQLMTAWSKAVEQNGVPEEKAAAAFKPYEGEQTADESVRRQTLGLEPEEGRAAELKQSIKAIDDELSRYDNTETPEGIYVNKETGEEVPEETIERLKQNKEQLRTELMDIEPDEATTRERVFGIKQEEPVNEVEEIHEKAEIQKNAVLTDNEVAQRLERGTRDDLNTLAGNIGYRIELSDHLVPEDADMSLDVGVNGWIDKKNRVIKLALDATDDIETLRSRVLKVVAIHETTHGLETLAPEEYKSYADYVENNWDTLNDGEDYATALENKLKQYRDAGKDIDEEGARQELMAEFASHMDQDAIFNFVNSNPTVGQKIVQMFRDIVAKLREMFGMSGDAGEALRKWENAYRAAVKGTANVNNKTQVEEAYRAGIEVQDNNGEPVAIMSEDGQAQFSMRTYKEEGRDTLSTWLDKAVARKHLSRKEADELLAEMDRIYEVCEELSKSPDYVPFTRWSQATVKRGKDNEPLLHVITPNGEYSLNLDVALVCKKRQTLDKVFDRLIKKGVFDNFDMGQEDIANINQIIVKHNFETACAICFVESKRFRQAKLAEDFAEQYNTFLRGMMPEGTEATYFNFGGDPNLDNHNASVTNDVSQLDKSELNLKTKYTVEVPDPENSKKKKTDERTLKQLAEETTDDGKLATRVDNKIARYLLNNAEGRHLLNRTDFIASSGFENVKGLSPEVLGLYNSKKGSGGPKSAFGFAQYMHEMLDKRAFNPKAAYAVGGVRIQSFSDFVPRMFFDYAEIVGDLAAKKLPAHAYTKEEAFVKLFGLTGIKINMSLVPASKEGGMAPGLDKDGNYLWEKGQTFDYDTAVQIQKADGYGDNCGTIAVGVSDMHIRKMLKDKNIRMIIPYHKSSLNPIIAAMNGISDFTDYTDYQNTRYADGTKLDKKDAKKEVNFNVLMHSKHMDPQQAAEAYVRWCEENNYLPRFDQFTYAQDENGEYIVEDGKLKVDENYYKLLEDFTLYNEPSDPNAQRGDYVPQHEVKLRLPTDDDAFGSWKSLLTEDQYDENGNRIYQGAFNADAELDAKQEREIDAVVEDIEKNLNTPAVRERISQEQLAERQAHGDELRAAERQRYEEGLAKRRAAVQPTTQYALKKPNQEIDSKDTSQNQIPAALTKYKLTSDDRVLDWGGGKYDTGKQAVEKLYPDIEFEIYDPYNRTDTHNERILKEFEKKPASVLTVNNVLNVIKEEGSREDLIRDSKEYLAPDGRAYFYVYEGESKNRGQPKASTKGWQNNMPASWYEPMIKKYYKYTKVDGGAIIASDEPFNIKDLRIDKEVAAKISTDEFKEFKKDLISKRLDMSQSQYSLSFNKNIEDIDPTKPLKTLQGSTIKRAQNNVGKEIGGQIYVHKNYASDTKIPADVLARGEELVPDDFEYNSVMWDKAKPNEIRFDEAPDFDTATEPQVGHFLKINTETGNITAGYSPNIWHHKWLWVKDDYDGFDTREAYDRSQTWLSQVKGTAKGTIKSWNKQLEENGMEPIDSEPVPKNQEFLDRYNSKPKGIFPTKEEADRMNGEAEKPKSNVQFSISPTGKVEGFYSELQNTINESKQNKMKPSQWLQYAKGHGQIKQEEIDYSGILSLPDESITKEDLLDYLRANQIELEEETLTPFDDNPEEYSYVDPETDELLSFSDIEDRIENEEIPYYIIDRYKLRGRDAVDVDYRLDFGDYRYNGSASLKVVAEFSDHGYPREITVGRFEISDLDETLNNKAFDYSHWDQYTTPGGSNYREILLKIPGSEYTNSAMDYHWGESFEIEGRTGIISHARVNDFTNEKGDKVLFVEEIQSDWHNQGQKKGYYDKAENNTEVNIFNDNLPAPDAPFKDSYVSLTLKRLLSEAVENGYDRLAWTTAQMQSDRWLEKYAEGYRIEYDQEIPKFLNKYVKKWGSKVEPMEMLGKNVGSEEIPVQRAYEVPSIPITDAMRESISTKGQPQFSLSNESNKTNEQYQILFANLGLDLNATPMEFKKNKTPKQSKVVTNTYARTEVFDEAMEFIQDAEKKIEARNAGRRLKENSEYDPISTREAMTQAKEALIDDYAGEKKRLLNTNEEWGSKELHEAMSIACTELANGNIKEFYKMGLRVKNKGTQGGQLVQAFKIYSKTPEGAAIQVLSNVEDKLGTIPPDVEEKVQDLAQQLRAIKDGDMDSIIEIIRRQAEIRKTPIGEHTLNQLRKETFQANYDRVYAQLMGIEDDARARNPAADSKTFWQKVSTWQLVSHLLNLRTGGRNLVSNTGFGGAETIANDLAMIPDYIISSVFGTGKRTVGFEYLSGAAVRAGFDRARGTAIDVKLDIDTEKNRNKYGGTRRTWKMASSNPLAKGMSMAEMLLGYELNVTDEFAKGMHDYRIRSGLQKWADAGLITQEQVDMASEKEMLYRTFQDDTYPGMILNGIKNGLNVIGFGHTGRFTKYGGFEIKQFGVGDLVQKYTQVPGALLTRMVEYTPAGYAKMLYNIAAIKSTQKKVQQELTRASGERAKQLRQLDNDLFTYQREAALSFGRASTGSMIISMFFALAASGILHDEHSEEGDEQADKNAAAIRALQGISGTQLNWSALGRWIDKHDSKIEWQSGDKLIGIDFLEPFNGLMSIAATIAQDEYIMNDEYKGLYDKTTVMGQDMLHSLVNSFADVPTMQSIQNIQNAVRYHSKDSKYTVEFEVGLELLKGSITGFVPAPVRQVAQFQDDYYRDLYSQKDPFQQSADALRNSIPGLRQKLPEKLTPYGEPKEMEDKKQRALNAFVNPGKVTTFKQSELEKVLSAMDSNKLYPARNAPNKLDFGSERSLNPDEKRKYQEILGSTYTEEMTNLINTDAFKNASKGEQKDMLTEMKTFASKEGKAKIAAELKDDYSKTSEVNKILTVRSTGVALSDYNDFHVAACGVNSEGKLGSPSQGRAEAWIDSKGKELKLTNRQKRTLWMSCNKQWKEKNCPYPDNDDVT